jgi:hypothetical protein
MTASKGLRITCPDNSGLVRQTEMDVRTDRHFSSLSGVRLSGPGDEAFLCPGCGNANVPPGRVFCRPSCRAKYEHRERQREPLLFPHELTMESEL